jgi:hypothetical protein
VSSYLSYKLQVGFLVDNLCYVKSYVDGGISLFRRRRFASNCPFVLAEFCFMASSLNHAPRDTKSPVSAPLRRQSQRALSSVSIRRRTWGLPGKPQNRLKRSSG